MATTTKTAPVLIEYIAPASTAGEHHMILGGEWYSVTEVRGAVIFEKSEVQGPTCSIIVEPTVSTVTIHGGKPVDCTCKGRRFGKVRCRHMYGAEEVLRRF